jgi:hypothetical protein
MGTHKAEVKKCMACKERKSVQEFDHPIEIEYDRTICTSCFERIQEKRALFEQLRLDRENKIGVSKSTSLYQRMYLITSLMNFNGVIREFNIILVCKYHEDVNNVLKTFLSCNLVDVHVSEIGYLEYFKFKSYLFEVTVFDKRRLGDAIYRVLLEIKKYVNVVKSSKKVCNLVAK